MPRYEVLSVHHFRTIWDSKHYIMSYKSCSQNLCNSTRAKAAVQILLLKVITQCKADAIALQFAGMSLQNFGGNVQPLWLWQPNLLLLLTFWDWMPPITHPLITDGWQGHYEHHEHSAQQSGHCHHLQLHLHFQLSSLWSPWQIDWLIVNLFLLCCVETCDLQKWKNKQDNALKYLRTVTSANI